MRVAGALALVGLVGGLVSGCTSVKVGQRDGCWVKRTERFYQVKEELGPCMRAPPAWVEDRHTRLVQECVAQADYRYQTAALEAWQKGQPLPAEKSQEQVLQMCMAEASKAYVNENEELKKRLAEVADDRELLKQAVAEDREHLRNSHEKIAEYLGEAAQKPAGTATATATASGSGDSKLEPATAPAMTYVVAPGNGTQQRTSSIGDAAGSTLRKAKSGTAIRAATPLCTPPPKEGTIEKAVEEKKPLADDSIAKVVAPAGPVQDAAAPAQAPGK